MTATPTKRRAILIFTLNRSGVLNKIAMLIRRRMLNVDTITACETQQPGTVTWHFARAGQLFCQYTTPLLHCKRAQRAFEARLLWFIGKPRCWCCLTR